MTSTKATDSKKPPTGTCGRCSKRLPLFLSLKEWGEVPELLCVQCWSEYKEARERKSYVDFKDAFDNATDEEFFQPGGRNE